MNPTNNGPQHDGGDGYNLDVITSALNQISDWSSFDVFRLASASRNQPLQHITIHILANRGIINRLNIDQSILSTFIAAIESNYTALPYHNSTHAADVVQAVGTMIAVDSWPEALQDWELLALIIAAAAHDVGHPGVNNDFHIRTKSDAAKLYGSVGSINENGHAAKSLELLLNPAHNFIHHFDPDATVSFTNLLKTLILSTDMMHHRSIVDTFKSSIHHSGNDIATWPMDNKINAMKMILHCADISNPARPLAHCTEWGNRVQEEMYQQGEKEKALGLHVTPAFDRQQGTVRKSQAAFIKHVMRPCIVELQPVAPNFVATVLPFIDVSLSHWNYTADIGCATGSDAGGTTYKSDGARDGCCVGGSDDEEEKQRTSEIITYIAP